MKKRALSLILAVFLLLTLLPTAALAAETGEPAEAPAVTLAVTDGDGDAVPEDGYTYDIGDTTANLIVEADADVEGGSYAYQWRYKAEADSAAFTKAGTTSQIKYDTFKKVYTDKENTRYYYCHVTYTLNGTAYELDSPLVKVSVIATKAQMPGVTVSSDCEFLVNGAVLPIKVTANVGDGGTLSYQWYLAQEGGEFAPVSGETSASLTPSATEACTLGYYCVVTNTLKSVSGDTYTASAQSDTVTAVFKNAADFGAGWAGKGTASEPFLLKNTTDLQMLSKLCADGLGFEGMYFKITEDITLPEAWVPVGTTKNRFSGSIDGDNHLLTVPAGEKALIGSPKGAVLKNLNIYGESINGNGVVDIYTTGVKGVTAITIENVTLKSGTKTLLSGFVGGYAPGDYPVIIRNCTVEKDVIIGYDGTKSNIGSFGGDFNGVIQSCVSYATVKGADYVGGICGSKGQTMGDYRISDCAFYGSVEASGSYAGGISGGGYAGTSWGLASGPNTPCATIQNCMATGSVSGANCVGGILGAEPGVQECWANGVGYIQNNLFTGTVSATDESAFVGGVIGYMNSLDRFNVITGNYYAEACGAAKGIGGFGRVEALEDSGSFGSGWNTYTLSGKIYGRTDDPEGADAGKLSKSCTASELSDGTVVKALNSGLNSSGDWRLNAGQIDFGGKRHIVAMTCSALSSTGGVSEKVGENALEGKTIVLSYSDGSSEAVDGSLASRGYTTDNSMADTSIAAGAVYNNHQLVFRLNIKQGDAAPSAPSASGITVSFALLGDSDHGESGERHTLKDGNLTPWIAKTTVAVPAGSKVMTVLSKALNQYGYSWMNDDKSNGSTGNYIQSITKDGVTLAEFSNGKNSGWMYTLNGEHPLLGVSEQAVADGDVIVFHYTDDYTKEQGSESWTPSAPSNQQSATISPSAAISGDTATVTPTASEMAAAIDTAASGDKELVIAPKDTGSAAKVEVVIPAASAKKVSENEGLSLKVETASASVTIPNETVSEIAAAAAGDVTVTVAQKAAADLEDKTVDAENAVIVEVKVSSGDKAVTSFGGRALKISVPVGEGYTTGEQYRVIVLSAGGKKEVMAGKCVTKDGKTFVEVETLHLSTYIVKNEKTVNFSDVAADAWYNAGVIYAAENGLMGGTGEGAFAPDGGMTRAMLVTVLYRMAGSPAVSGKCAFTDVPAGTWYTDAVIWATENEIVNGMGGGLFAPNEAISRQQAAAVLYRFSGSPTCEANLSAFADANAIADWALDSMKWASAKGIVTGTNAGLEPLAGATRAQTAALLMRYRAVA